MGRCINLIIQCPFSYVLWLLTSEDNVSLSAALGYPSTAPGKLATWASSEESQSLSGCCSCVWLELSKNVCAWLAVYPGELAQSRLALRNSNLSIRNHLVLFGLP